MNLGPRGVKGALWHRLCSGGADRTAIPLPGIHVELFSEPWISAFRRRLEVDERYAAVDPPWTAPLVFESTGDGSARRAFLRLDAGRCIAVRTATDEDRAEATVVMTGDAGVWHTVLAGDRDPVLALVQEALRLEVGSLRQLLRHQGTARALLKVAAAVTADFPPEGPGSLRAVQSRPADRPLHPGLTSLPLAGARGLDHDLVPMRLYHEAKRLGIWDPRAIDLSRDRIDWETLSSAERHLLLRIASFFQAGDDTVARDLLPLLQVIGNSGRLEEEMYLTSFLFEEAKHAEVFRRFLDEVAADHGDLRRFETPAYRTVFSDELPTALYALRGDASPRAQIRAVVTYNLVVEGVLAETGYHGYLTALGARGVLPGMQQAVRLLRRDEGRHIAYALYLVSRILRDDPQLWPAVQADLGRLLDPALAVVAEVFEPYETVPFGLEPEDFTGYALDRFRVYLDRLDRARQIGAVIDEPVESGAGLLTAP
ncbi:MAG TPA: R2-like ligand-binding oxidase [Longimicrobiales bacterium]|nr:R2-like ligand-binding oxidase [Longimicrobiales bacterium]